MLILTVDFTSESGSVSVSRSGTTEAYVSINLHRQPLRFCTHAVQSALEVARSEMQDVDLLCTVVGPGAWTGLRVSSTVMNAFAFTLRVPHVPLNLFEIYQFAISKSQLSAKAIVQISSTQLAIANIGGNDEIGMGECMVRLDELPEDLDCDNAIVKSDRGTYEVLSSLYVNSAFTSSDTLQPPAILASILALERYNDSETGWDKPAAPYYGSSAIG